MCVLFVIGCAMVYYVVVCVVYVCVFARVLKHLFVCVVVCDVMLHGLFLLCCLCV